MKAGFCYMYRMSGVKAGFQKGDYKKVILLNCINMVLVLKLPQCPPLGCDIVIIWYCKTLYICAPFISLIGNFDIFAPLIFANIYIDGNFV